MTNRSFKVYVYGALIFIIGLFVTPKKFGVDPEFNKYVKMIEVLSHGNLRPVENINFGKTKGNAIGTCRDTFIAKEITIDKKYWTKSTYYDRIILLAHEIAHCYKGVRHNDGLMSDFCAISFMNSYDMGSHCNKKHFKRYVKEMQEI